MRDITRSIAVAAILAIFSAGITDADAGSKPGGGGSHNSGSSSRPSSGGGSGYSKPSSPSPSSGGSGYSKPSTTPSSGSNGYAKPATPSATTNSQQGYTKPSTPSQPNTGSPAGQSTLGSASTKSMSQDSLKAYQAERATASKPPQTINTADAKNNPARSTYKNTDQYMSNRTTIVSNYYNTYPGLGGITYHMHPNYGIYDSGFLTGMVMGYVGGSIINNAMWMYSHSHEPWYSGYRADLEAQAANNADLRARLNQMDAEMAKLKAQNVQPQPVNTLPTGVDPALAIAPEAMMTADADEGMSWWWAVVFFGVGLLAALIAVKLFK